MWCIEWKAEVSTRQVDSGSSHTYREIGCRVYHTAGSEEAAVGNMFAKPFISPMRGIRYITNIAPAPVLH